tara:strand:+ start:355 stop:801 length:447 start_codon:yes stop_codon:yes gene_type:complete
MSVSIAIERKTIIFVIFLVAFAGFIGVTYGEDIAKIFVPASQQCPAGKCVYGFDEEGSILCKPCAQDSSHRSCIWMEETVVIEHEKEANFQYDGCNKGEEYAHGEFCALGIGDTQIKCLANGYMVKWQRAKCVDGLWSKGTERYCKNN